MPSGMIFEAEADMHLQNNSCLELSALQNITNPDCPTPVRRYFKNIPCRLGFGWVTDKKIMTIPSFMTLVLILQGAFIALFPFAMSLSSFMILLMLYGITAGSILVLFPVLVMQYVSNKEQSVAMACVGFLSGIMSFAIPALIGHFRDVVGSYDGMFYLTGIVSVVTGGLWLLEPIVVKYHYGEKSETEEDEKSEKSIDKPTMKGDQTKRS